MKIAYIFLLTVFIFLFTACQTIEKKSQQAIKKENEQLSKFLNQHKSELEIVMGKPDEIVVDDKGSKFLVYIAKKYKITCERRFEVNENEMIVGFTSKGCF